jgi:uncharacterized protein with beta-barrel porin domain
MQFLFIFLLLAAFDAQAVTLTSDQLDYTTTSDITTDDSGIISSFSGTSSSLRKITNNHVITTGNDGANSSAYGIRLSGDYYQIENSSDAEIITTGSSGRGISISDFSIVNNSGSISTEGSTSYGIYGGGSANLINNLGEITTLGSSSYGIYFNGDDNEGENSGSISTSLGYGVYLNGSRNQFINSGSILTTSGSTAYGIYISAGSSLTADSSNFTSVTNSGIISSNSHAIYNKDNYVNISNSGSLSVTSSSSIYGIRNEADNVVISNSGAISANRYAIYNSGQNITINNSGNLSGGVRLSSGILNILGGSISGIVDGDAKQGSVEIGSGVAFSQSANFEELAKLTLNSNSTFNSAAQIEADVVEILNGATLNLNSGFSLSNSVIQGFGTLNINSDFDVAAAEVTLGTTANQLEKISISAGTTLDAAQNIYAQNLDIFGTINLDETDGLIIAGSLAAQDGATINLGENNHQITEDFSLNQNAKLKISLKENGAGVGGFEVMGNAEISSLSKLEISTNSNQGYIASGTKFKLVAADDISAISQIDDANISLNNSGSNIAGLLEYSSIVQSDGLYLMLERLDKKAVTKNSNLQNIYQNLNEIGVASNGYLLDFQEYLDSGAVDVSNADFALSQLRANSSKMALAVSYAALDNSLKTVEKRLDAAKEINLWIRPLGFSAEQNEVKNDAAFGFQSSGAIVGADNEISDGFLFGGFFGYLRSDAKTKDDLQKNFVSSFLAGTYLRKNFSQFFFENISAFSCNKFDASRDIRALNLEAISQYWGQSLMTKFKIGREEKLKFGFKIIPQIGLGFSYNSISAYEEKGAQELNLKVKEIKSNYADVRAGGVLNWAGKIPEIREIKVFTTDLKFSYGKVLLADKAKTVAGFVNQSSVFEDQISQIDKTFIALGASISAYYDQGTTLSLNYDLEKRSTYQSHLVMVRINQSF